MCDEFISSESHFGIDELYASSRGYIRRFCTVFASLILLIKTQMNIERSLFLFFSFHFSFPNLLLSDYQFSRSTLYTPAARSVIQPNFNASYWKLTRCQEDYLQSQTRILYKIQIQKRLGLFLPFTKAFSTICAFKFFVFSYCFTNGALFICLDDSKLIDREFVIFTAPIIEAIISRFHKFLIRLKMWKMNADWPVLCVAIKV